MLAPTYSPLSSTIGADGLNFRVRNAPCLLKSEVIDLQTAVPHFLLLLMFLKLAPTYSPLSSTIGADGLNFRVRNENGCIPAAKAPALKTQVVCF